MTVAVSLMVGAGLAACGAPGANPEPSAQAAAQGVEVPAAVAKAGVVNVAAYLAYPPYRYIDGSGKPTGFELEMAKAVAKKMGVRIEFHSIEFPALIPSIANRRYDWAVGMMNDTEARRKVVDVLDWARADMVVQVQAGNPHQVNPAGLCGVNFGHVQGSAQVQAFDKLVADCAKQGKPAPTQILFQDVGTQLQALRNNRFAAALQDPAAGAQTEKQTSGALVLLPGRVPAITPTPAGWVFAKGNTGLQKAVVQAIGSLIKDGTWQKIMRDNGVSEFSIVPPTLNTARTNF
ncbi:transporter substrate-binding domain-containing protein [Amycolatopsis rubida]|uniref:Transporter substrate-binding domain-containing protein n=1 Tax=Amycolatopsis rubida TaxID=112413 RepID=A0ABX0C8C1_9PSEU|nr:MULTISPECIES: transporter substrate-binding domain-containing protein [Amycolatopsis]MYW96177.1 transporter substrate-binding domain-containing protein [Amycolatopsis rubida]NEC61168.1 transporter substrate-binding domain-containing protein [Amycolatopsis rubida]